MVATASEQGTLIRLWGFPSCSKLMEFRRGVDPAVIFSMAFSPTGKMLAVSSDKSTVHIFDLPDEETGAYPIPASSTNQLKQHKWGVLSRVPFLPRQFSDTYSNLTQKFEIGNEPEGWGTASKSATFNAGIPGVPGGRPTKGLVGWLDDNSFVVIGAGQDARWEKFNVGETPDGKRGVEREGWKRYLE
jgi:WD repeat-containing protein 45